LTEKDEIKNEMGRVKNEIKDDVGKVKNEIKNEMGKVKNEIKNEVDQVKNEVTQVSKVKNELEAKLDKVDSKVTNIELNCQVLPFKTTAMTAVLALLGMFTLMEVFGLKNKTIKPKEDVDIPQLPQKE